MQDIFIERLMSQNVATAQHDAPLCQVIDKMYSNKYSCIIIVDDDCPVGIITERDIVALFHQVSDYTQANERLASEVMSGPLVTVQRSSTLFDALVVLGAENIRHIPVIENEKLVGLITHSDLVKAHFKLFDSLQDIIENSIEKRLDELKQANEKLRTLSLQDSLTSIGNRRAMEVDLHHVHSAFLRYHRHYSVILIDIDLFKSYNDHYGHIAGDHALKKVATSLKDMIRTSDRIYRYGGEEFLMLLPETTIDQASILAERLVRAILELSINHAKSPWKFLSISAGLGSVENDELKIKCWKDVVNQADKSLYASKSNGRNRVTMEPSS